LACFHRGVHAEHGGDAEGSRAFAEPGVGPTYGPSWAFRVVRAEVWLSIEPELRTYRGTSTFEIAAYPGFTGEVVLDLDVAGVQVEGVEVDGAATDRWRPGEAKLHVRGVRCGQRVTVRYQGAEPRAGLYFVGALPSAPDRLPMAWTQCQDEDAHFFMPCLDHPRVKHPWRITLEAPEVYTLLSNGRCVSEEVTAGRRVVCWEQEEPMPAYLFTAVAAQLDVVEDSGASVPVRYLVPKGRGGQARLAMGRTPRMIAHFEAVTGVPFPWPRYDQVVVYDFVFGGMENTGCTTMTEGLLVDERVGDHWHPDGLVAHELAHQWFGDLVTCRDWSQAWLNESFATFMEVVWWEEAFSAEEASWYAFSLAEAYLEEDRTRYRRPITSYDFREPIDLFDRHLYEKGGVVLRTLRGELGEQAFWEGVGAYLRENAHGTVHGRQLQTALEDATGRNLDRFFAQWVTGAGHPQLEVELAEADGLVTVSVRQTQSGEGTAEVFHFDLEVEVRFEDGSAQAVRLPVRERERVWAVPVQRQVSVVRVDPQMALLSELKLKAPTPWLTRLAEDPSPVLATRAVRALAERGGARLPIAGRSHPFWGVRANWARAVGAWGGEQAAVALAEALAEESEPRALAAIATALGQVRGETSASGLIARLEGPPTTWHATGALLHALGRTRDPRAREVLERHLDLPSWSELITQHALAGLGATRLAEVLPTLIARTDEALGERVVSAAARALGALGAEVESVRREARERLEQLALHGGFRVRVAAVGALRQLGDPAAAAVLGQVHTRDADGRVRRQAYEAARALRAGGDAVPALQAQLDGVIEAQRKLRERIDKLGGPVGS
jgi:aminopeptidase N